MTVERAMEILDPEHRERYEDLEEVNEACRMGRAALAAQRTGRWVVSEYEYLDCSLCGQSMFTGCNSTREANELKNHWKPYCPHCGARMETEAAG